MRGHPEGSKEDMGGGQCEPDWLAFLRGNTGAGRGREGGYLECEGGVGAALGTGSTVCNIVITSIQGREKFFTACCILQPTI